MVNPLLLASTYGPPADKYEHVVYDYGGITYVPHYRNKNIFVGPGYPFNNTTRYTDLELQLRGAKPRTMMLWNRGNSDRVDDRNP